jgi:integrase
MSSPDHLKAELHNTTRPTLAELRARILADETLPPARRRDMASALASFAKALGQPAETVPADPASLRPRIAGLAPAMVGLKPGRWRNVLSLTTAALAHTGIILVQGRIREKPSPEWLAILNLLPTTAGPRFHLWRFARYCTLGGIKPGSVTDATLTQYQQDLKHRSLVSDPARCAREVARAWNDALGMFSAWPRQHLTVPDNRTGFALPFEAYPASLSQEINGWCEWLSGTGPFEPLSPTSIATRRRQIRAWLGALVHEGVDPEELTNLAAMVAPARARLALRFIGKRSGQERSFHLHQLMGMVLAIARHWAKLPDTDIDQLKILEKRCRPEAAGMTSRNMERLRQLDDPERLRAFATLPDDLMDKASRAGKGGVQSALLAQTSVVIDLLLAVPMRLRNLAALRIGTHLSCWSDVRMLLSVPAEEIKNKVPIVARLPADLSKRIRVYVDRYRPLLAVDNGDWLFPGAKGGAHKSEDGLRTQMKKALAIHTGVQFNPHLYRHFAAWITLRDNPGAHGQVQRILGHKSLYATMAFYSGLETPAALDHYDALIERERREPTLAQPKTKRRGRN